MYNKLFSKIVDSSIWLEPTPTRIVWLMFIALMDEDGFVYFASEANVAQRAIISLDEAKEAINILESPDPNSADQDNEGKRIERVPGGWLVINASKHRNLVTREMVREQTRIRVARHRAKLKGNVTNSNAPLRTDNGTVTPSEAEVLSDTEAKKDSCPSVGEIYDAYPRHEKKPQAIAAIQKALKKFPADFILERTKLYATTRPPRSKYTPLPASWFNAEQFNDDPSEWERDEGKTSKPKKPWDARPKAQFGDLYQT